MSENAWREDGPGAQLDRLWRFGLVLSGSRAAAEDLVQATCLRPLERAHQFAVGTRLDRGLFAILHSIWLNELRAARYRRGEGLCYGKPGPHSAPTYIDMPG